MKKKIMFNQKIKIEMRNLIKRLKKALNKTLVIYRFKKISDEDIYGFMCASRRFKNAGYERRWHLLNEDGSEKGLVWFKHLLGGWRLRLNTDKGDEWQERGVIETVTKMKTFF